MRKNVTVNSRRYKQGLTLNEFVCLHRGMKEAGKDLYKPVIITLMYKVFLFQTGVCSCFVSISFLLHV